MGCGASKVADALLPPESHEMPTEPNFDLPMWNQYCKGKLEGKLASKDNFKMRVRAQREILFSPGCTADKESLDKFEATAMAEGSQVLVMFHKKKNEPFAPSSRTAIHLDSSARVLWKRLISIGFMPMSRR